MYMLINMLNFRYIVKVCRLYNKYLYAKAANLNNTILGANYLKLIDHARQTVQYVIGWKYRLEAIQLMMSTEQVNNL